MAKNKWNKLIYKTILTIQIEYKSFYSSNWYKREELFSFCWSGSRKLLDHQ